MKEERNQLSVVHFIDVFENHYVIEEDLILKDLSVYAMDIDGSLIDSVNFIISQKNGLNIISPIGSYSKYALLGRRLIRCNIVHIFSDEYPNINRLNLGDLDIGGEKKD